MKRLTVYLAGPISGGSYDEVVNRILMREQELTDAGFHVFHPMAGKQELRTELEFKANGYEDFPVSANHAIFRRDHWMVKQADIVLADLTTGPDRVSIGTMFELAWAVAYSKHVVVVLPDENIHEHAFVLEAADIRWKTIEEAVHYLKSLVGVAEYA